jgi:hypothetical protein
MRYSALRRLLSPFSCDQIEKGNSMKGLKRSNLLSVVIIMILVMTGCGGKVEGNTYSDNGGHDRIQVGRQGLCFDRTGLEHLLVFGERKECDAHL